MLGAVSWDTTAELKVTARSSVEKHDAEAKKNWQTSRNLRCLTIVEVSNTKDTIGATNVGTLAAKSMQDAERCLAEASLSDPWLICP